MRKLKIFLTFLIVFIAFNTLSAQVLVENTTKQEKETINTSKKTHKIVKHKGISYYIIDGMWHTKLKKKYVLRSAPKGACTDFLPIGGENVKMGGKKYYRCKGVFYKPIGKGKYEVVSP